MQRTDFPTTPGPPSGAPAVHRPGRPAGVGPREGIRTGRYKLIRFLHGAEGWELFGLESDPDELHDLYRSPGHRQLVAERKQRLAALKRRKRAPDHGASRTRRR